MSTNDKKGGPLRQFALYGTLLFLLLSIAAVYLTAGRGEARDDILRLHGWVEGTNVTLSAKISGQVKELPLEEGDWVAVGQLVAVIESEQIQAQVKNAAAEVVARQGACVRAANEVAVLEGTLATAEIALKLAVTQSEAQIEQAAAGLAAAKAQLVEAEARFTKAEKDYHRFQPLVEKKTLSQSTFDSVAEEYAARRAAVDRVLREVELHQANLAMARTSKLEIELQRSNVFTTKRRLDAARSTEEIETASLHATQAKHEEIQATLDDASIFSPVQGTVIDKVAEPGEHVRVGTPLGVLVDLDQLFIKTYVEQSNVGKIKIGDSVRIKMDSFPDRVFDGTVYFVAPRAEFTPPQYPDGRTPLHHGLQSQSPGLQCRWVDQARPSRRPRTQPGPSQHMTPENPWPLVQAEGLVKRFKGVAAVQHVDFTVQPGEIFGLVGADGAGKTTILQMLCGISPPPPRGCSPSTATMWPGNRRQFERPWATCPRTSPSTWT